MITVDAAPRRTYRQDVEPQLRTRAAGPIIAAVVVAAAYIVLAAWQWSRFTVKSWDLGIFTQLLASYARPGPPIVNIKGDGYNLLGDHFHPLLALLAPVFALFPYAFTLLVIQAVCFGTAAGMLGALATRQLGTRVGGCLFGMAFGLSWGLQYAAEAQFHEIAVAVPLLTGAMSAIIERRWRAAVLWSAPLVFVKEDLGLTVVVIGILIAAMSRSARSLWLSVWGVGWFLTATLLVLPSMNAAGRWAYGGNVDIAGLLANPDDLFAPQKWHTLGMLFLASAGFLLGSPLTLVLVPTLAWRFLSTNEGYWGPTWHYSAVLMPVLFAASLDGIRRWSQSRHAPLRSYARHGTAVTITIATMLLPTLPLADAVRPDAWQVTEREINAQTALAAVPADASVETDIGLMSYLVDDHDVFWIGNRNRVPDCIVIDHAGGGTPAEWGDAVEVGRHLRPGADYTMTATAGSYEVACLRR